MSGGVIDVLSKSERMERLRLSLLDPEAIALYEELAEEDVRLAEAALAEYVAGLAEADKA